jgi:hypothetical protein
VVASDSFHSALLAMVSVQDQFSVQADELEGASVPEAV